MLQIAERPLDIDKLNTSQSEMTYFNTWWLTFITCTTVGYGDFSAQTT